MLSKDDDDAHVAGATYLPSGRFLRDCHKDRIAARYVEHDNVSFTEAASDKSFTEDVCTFQG
jgi:hypothetical protein